MHYLKLYNEEKKSEACNIIKKLIHDANSRLPRAQPKSKRAVILSYNSLLTKRTALKKIISVGKEMVRKGGEKKCRDAKTELALSSKAGTNPRRKKRKRKRAIYGWRR